MAVWRLLECSCKDLQLILTLSGGQCFRWHKNEDEEWTGVFANRIWSLKQTNNEIMYKVQYANYLVLQDNDLKGKKNKQSKKSNKSATSPDEEILAIEDVKLLHQYFRLEESLDELYSLWCKNDVNFKDVSAKFCGVRMLRQEPTENIFSFICSSNNNIPRISSMVEKMCSLYGPIIGVKDGHTYHAFPDVGSLADPIVEQQLRTAGFGYRAKFIQQSAAKIQKLGGQAWLQSLQGKTYKEAKESLMELPGIGAKVADCICLMSLNHLEAIPVDTHVWQISCRYLPHLKSYKSVTEKVYNEIGEYFRSLYGSYAGWAHTVLFCADLKMFQEKQTVKRRKDSSVREDVKKKK